MNGGSGFGKGSALLNLIKKQDDDKNKVIDKIYLYVKDLNEAKYQYLITKCEHNGPKELENPKALIEYLNDTQNVYKNFEEYNTE